MNVGFTLSARPDRARIELREPTATSGVPLVTWARAGPKAAVLYGRLYHRDAVAADVLARARGRVGTPTPIPDAAFALWVYQELGAAAMQRLEGDFAVAVFDANTAEVVARRDPLGGYPLFWTSSAAGITFGTALGPLLQVAGRAADPDPEYLADFLAMAELRGEVGCEATVYRGVHRVRAGEMVRADLRSGRVARMATWDWFAAAVDPGTDQLEEVAEPYAAAVRAAVRDRMGATRTAAHLSGGMDSTTVALLAAEVARHGQAPGPVQSISFVYHALPRLARETPFVEVGIEAAPDLCAHRVPADDVLDYDAFADPPPHDEPSAGLWRVGMDRAGIDVAASVGADALLTGIGADEQADLKPYHLAGWLRRGRWLRAWREAARWAEASACNAWEYLHPFGIIPTLARTAPGLRYRRPAALRELTETSVPPWVAPDFARRYGLADRLRSDAGAVYRRHPSAGLSVLATSLDFRAGDPVRWSVAAPRGISLSHPFLDPRVLALGLGIQARVQATPGRMKPLLNAAFGAILPAPITERRAKGYFDEVYYLGLARNLRILEDMVRRAPIDEFGLFDRARLVGCLEEASLGGPNGRQLMRLDLSLCLVRWLCSRGEWHRAVPPPTVTLIVGAAEPAAGLVAVGYENLPSPQGHRR